MEANIVDLAYQIIYMHEDLISLKRENERLKEYERKYNELLRDGIKHGEKMTSSILAVLLSRESTHSDNNHEP